MGVVVCGNVDCKYHSKNAPLCGRDYTMLNSAGMCSIFFDGRGMMRQVPMYDIEVEPVEAAEQQPPH